MRAVICATALLLTCAVGSAQARPKPAVRATFPKAGTVGEPLKFKGRAVNAPTARTARLEERVGKHWRARKRARVSKKRRFTVSWKPSQAGLRTVRVSILRRNGTVLARTHRAVVRVSVPADPEPPTPVPPSPPSGPVILPVPDPFPAPRNLTRPQISGAPEPGKTLHCEPGTWENAGSFAYTWLRDGSAAGTGTDFAVAAADLDHDVACRVLATGLGGSTPADSVGLRVVEHIEPVPVPGLLVAAGPQRVAASWAAFDTGTVTDVELQTATNATGPFSTAAVVPADELGTVITGLADGVTVFVRARAVLAGDAKGPWTAVRSATPAPTTVCGPLTHDEVIGGIVEPGCQIDLAGHTLMLEPGTELRSQGIVGNEDSALIAFGAAGTTTRITPDCTGPDQACVTNIELGDAALRLRRTALERQSVTLTRTEGDVSSGSVTDAVIYATDSTVAWRGNAFLRASLRLDHEAPRLIGNSFAGLDDPVSLQQSTDLSGVHDNTASGPSRHGVFAYNGVHVTGRWTPEAAGSGIQHRFDDVRVADGGELALLPGALVKVGYLDVDDGGTLSSTGSGATGRAIVTATCDDAIGGVGQCGFSSPEDQLGAVTIHGGAHVDLVGADLRRQQLEIGDTPSSGQGATGQVKNGLVTDSRVYEHPGALLWTGNAFSRSEVRIDHGTPRLVGNAFAGQDDPVSLQASADLSGVHDNTATGTPRHGVFAYNGAHVTGHWEPEAAGSGVQHRVDDVDVDDGGDLALRPGVLMKVGYLDVNDGGALTSTGAAASRPVLTATCDDTIGGVGQCGSSSPGDQLGAVTVHGGAQVDLVRADLRRQQLEIGDASSTGDAAAGQVSDGVITDSRVYEHPGALKWTGNQFTNTEVRIDHGTPTLIANAFTGRDDPVSLQASEDVSNVHDNTASGTPREGVFAYNAVHVTGRWQPEAAGSGIQHRFDDVDVDDGGELVLHPGALVKVAYLDVNGGGTVSSDGAAATGQPIVTATCDDSVGGAGQCSFSSPDDQLGALTIRSGAHVYLVGADLRRQQLEAGDSSDQDAGAIGRVHAGSFTDSRIYEHPATLNWTSNAFVRSELRMDYGSPRLVGNSFTGRDDPVSLQASVDVSGVHDNTATGSPREGVFAYNGTHVTAPWHPEAAGSGVQHRFDDVHVDDGGELALRPGALVKVGYLDVNAGGTLSSTGSEETGRPVVTESCDDTIGGEGQCSFSPPDGHLGALTIRPEANVALDGADLRRQQMEIGATGSVIGAVGQVENSLITDSRITEQPATLDWTASTFANTSLDTRYGQLPTYKGNHFGDGSGVSVVATSSPRFDANDFKEHSTLRIQGSLRPELVKNTWTQVSNPLRVSYVADLSGIEPTNSASTDKNTPIEDEQRFVFDHSAVLAGATFTGTSKAKAIYEYGNVSIAGTYVSPKDALVDLTTDLDFGHTGKLNATNTTFRSKGDDFHFALKGDAGSVLAISGGAIEGKVIGSCETPYQGGADVSVSNAQFSGAAQYLNCNTDATGGKKAGNSGNKGLLYKSYHRNLCEVTPANPDFPPYPRLVWDVTGQPDDPPCVPPYTEVKNTSPTLIG